MESVEGYQAKVYQGRPPDGVLSRASKDLRLVSEEGDRRLPGSHAKSLRRTADRDQDEPA